MPSEGSRCLAHAAMVNCGNHISIRQPMAFLAIEKRLGNSYGKRIQASAIHDEALSLDEDTALVWKIRCSLSGVKALQYPFRFPSRCKPLYLGLQFIASRVSDCAFGRNED